ncbi:MAG: hypothetical protein M3Y53_12335, partial [Thermoproteota archaeon]|nr:hypothetical protein [Thermoproteota archaeon]
LWRVGPGRYHKGRVTCHVRLFGPADRATTGRRFLKRLPQAKGSEVYSQVTIPSQEQRRMLDRIFVFDYFKLKLAQEYILSDFCLARGIERQI